MSHQNSAILIALLLFVTFVTLLLFATLNLRKQVHKEWDIYKDYEKRVELVKTKEEIENLYNEIIEKCKNFTTPGLINKVEKILSYLKGMYQQYKN